MSRKGFLRALAGRLSRARLHRSGSSQSLVRVHWGVQALTVVCDLVLQTRQLVGPALGGARDELLPQCVAVQGLHFNIPIHSHVVQSIREGRMRMRGVGGVGGEVQQSRNDNAKISRLFAFA
jgi:hypothetical protein